MPWGLPFVIRNDPVRNSQASTTVEIPRSSLGQPVIFSIERLHNSLLPPASRKPVTNMHARLVLVLTSCALSIFAAPVPTTKVSCYAPSQIGRPY